MGLKSFARQSARRLNKVTPRWPAPGFDAPLVACSVYREKNSRLVRRMLGQLPRHTDVRLHALDAVSPELQRWTVSQGRGGRSPLLQALVDLKPLPEGSWVALVDDDVTFSLPGRTRFFDVAEAAALDIAGASIDVGEPFTFNHTQVRAASIARVVRMVEIGPLVAFSPAAIPHVFPLPNAGMGWGLDVRWSTLDDLRLGYVDASPIRHHGEVAVAYEVRGERDSVDAALRAAGLKSVYDLVGTVARWSAWQRRAPWLDTPRAGINRD